MLGGDGGTTLINALIGGGIAALLARVLQQQYEGRIDDLKQRIAEQSAEIRDLIAANRAHADRKGNGA